MCPAARSLDMIAPEMNDVAPVTQKIDGCWESSTSVNATRKWLGILNIQCFVKLGQLNKALIYVYRHAVAVFLNKLVLELFRTIFPHLGTTNNKKCMEQHFPAVLCFKEELTYLSILITFMLNSILLSTNSLIVIYLPFFLASSLAFCLAAEYNPVPNIAIMLPTQFIALTGFLKNRIEDTTTATLFIVFPTEKVTGDIP